MSDAPILEVNGLCRYFPLRNPWGVRTGWLRALDGVDFAIRRGEVLGVVGESGCGKSTLGKTIAGIHHPSSGSVRFEGNEIGGLAPSRGRALRSRLQYCYQDPGASLDPRWTIGRSLEEPLIVHTRLANRERLVRVHEVLDAVGMPVRYMSLYPHEISGGQQRRVGLARVLMLRPSLIILDEPTSGLDVSVQATVLNVFAALREAFALTYMFISHDLSIVRLVSDRIAVMYLGRVVEIGPTQAVFADPRHPYTQSLLAAVPVIGGRRVTETSWLKGEPPSPGQEQQGCRFSPRCPRATPHCIAIDPTPMVLADERSVACHYADEQSVEVDGASQ